MMSSGYIRLATKADADSIVALRLQAYRECKEFKLVCEDALYWSDMDEQFPVLCAFTRGGELISTMRGAVMPGIREAEEILGITAHMNSTELPCLLLGRGATAKHAVNFGMHTILRYHFLQAAVRENIRSCVGLVYANAPRTSLMSRLGYHFYHPDRVWDTEVIPLMTPLFAILRNSQFGFAINYIEHEWMQTMEAFPAIETALLVKKTLPVEE